MRKVIGEDKMNKLSRTIKRKLDKFIYLSKWKVRVFLIDNVPYKLKKYILLNELFL
jgi:hypothetical protein